MTREQPYKRHLVEKESARKSVQEIMEVIWNKVRPLDAEMERRILNGLITELQFALKEEKP